MIIKFQWSIEINLQFSFSRLTKADPVLGVDMSNTGEVGCISDSFYEAIAKAMVSVGYQIPKKNNLLSTGPVLSRVEFVEPCRLLAARGYKLFATPGIAHFLLMNGIEAQASHWPDEDAKPNVPDYLRSKTVELVVNIPKDLSHTELPND